MFEVIRHVRWTSSRKPALVMLGLWVAFFLCVHLSVTALNTITIPVLGLPLGVYVALQGSLVLFVAMVFWFARRARWSAGEER